MEPKPPIRDRAKALRPVQLVPNMMTLGAICAGLTSIRFAFDGNVVLSISLIMLAAVLDGLDGPTARLLKSETAIGAELDSLADFLNFGVAPGILLYRWALQDGRSGGWIAVLIFAICCALRLARFNVSSRAEPKGLPKLTFTGVPAPGGALLALLPLVLGRTFPGLVGPWLSICTGLWLVAVGLMMISRMPTPSPRMLRISREKAPYFMVGLIGFTAAFLTWHWPVLLSIQLAYLVVLARFALHPPRTRPAIEEEDDES